MNNSRILMKSMTQYITTQCIETIIMKMTFNMNGKVMWKQLINFIVLSFQIHFTLL